MDFHTMKRKELQALCKKHNIPANTTNLEMINRLTTLFKVEEKPSRRIQSCLKVSGETVVASGSSVVTRKAKKVRFSVEDETIEYIDLDKERDEYNSMETERVTRSRRRSMIKPETEKQDANTTKKVGPAKVFEEVREAPVRITRSHAGKLIEEEAIMVGSPLIENKNARRRVNLKIDGVKNFEGSVNASPVNSLKDEVIEIASLTESIRPMTRSLRNKDVNGLKADISPKKKLKAVSENGKKLPQIEDVGASKKNLRSKKSRERRNAKASEEMTLSIDEAAGIIIVEEERAKNNVRRGKKPTSCDVQTVYKCDNPPPVVNLFNDEYVKVEATEQIGVPMTRSLRGRKVLLHGLYVDGKKKDTSPRKARREVSENLEEPSEVKDVGVSSKNSTRKRSRKRANTKESTEGSLPFNRASNIRVVEECQKKKARRGLKAKDIDEQFVYKSEKPPTVVNSFDGEVTRNATAVETRVPMTRYLRSREVNVNGDKMDISPKTIHETEKWNEAGDVKVSKEKMRRTRKRVNGKINVEGTLPFDEASKTIIVEEVKKKKARRGLKSKSNEKQNEYKNDKPLPVIISPDGEVTKNATAVETRSLRSGREDDVNGDKKDITPKKIRKTISENQKDVIEAGYINASRKNATWKISRKRGEAVEGGDIKDAEEIEVASEVQVIISESIELVAEADSGKATEIPFDEYNHCSLGTDLLTHIPAPEFQAYGLGNKEESPDQTLSMDKDEEKKEGVQPEAQFTEYVEVKMLSHEKVKEVVGAKETDFDEASYSVERVSMAVVEEIIYEGCKGELEVNDKVTQEELGDYQGEGEDTGINFITHPLLHELICEDGETADEKENTYFDPENSENVAKKGENTGIYLQSQIATGGVGDCVDKKAMVVVVNGSSHVIMDVLTHGIDDVAEAKANESSIKEYAVSEEENTVFPQVALKYLADQKVDKLAEVEICGNSFFNEHTYGDDEVAVERAIATKGLGNPRVQNEEENTELNFSADAVADELFPEYNGVSKEKASSERNFNYVDSTMVVKEEVNTWFPPQTATNMLGDHDHIKKVAAQVNGGVAAALDEQVSNINVVTKENANEEMVENYFNCNDGIYDSKDEENAVALPQVAELLDDAISVHEEDADVNWCDSASLDESIREDAETSEEKTILTAKKDIVMVGQDVELSIQIETWRLGDFKDHKDDGFSMVNGSADPVSDDLVSEDGEISRGKENVGTMEGNSDHEDYDLAVRKDETVGNYPQVTNEKLGDDENYMEREVLQVNCSVLDEHIRKDGDIAKEEAAIATTEGNFVFKDSKDVMVETTWVSPQKVNDSKVYKGDSEGSEEVENFGVTSPLKPEMGLSSSAALQVNVPAYQGEEDGSLVQSHEMDNRIKETKEMVEIVSEDEMEATCGNADPNEGICLKTNASTDAEIAEESNASTDVANGIENDETMLQITLEGHDDHGSHKDEVAVFKVSTDVVKNELLNEDGKVSEDKAKAINMEPNVDSEDGKDAFIKVETIGSFTQVALEEDVKVSQDKANATNMEAEFDFEDDKDVFKEGENNLSSPQVALGDLIDYEVGKHAVLDYHIVDKGVEEIEDHKEVVLQVNVGVDSVENNDISQRKASGIEIRANFDPKDGKKVAEGESLGSLPQFVPGELGDDEGDGLLEVKGSANVVLDEHKVEEGVGEIDILTMEVNFDFKNGNDVEKEGEVENMNGTMDTVLDEHIWEDGEVLDEHADITTMEENFDNKKAKNIDVVEKASVLQEEYNDLESNTKEYANETFAKTSLLKPEISSNDAVDLQMNASVSQGDVESKFNIAAYNLFSEENTEEAEFEFLVQNNDCKGTIAKETFKVISVDEFMDTDGNKDFSLSSTDPAENTGNALELMSVVSSEFGNICSLDAGLADFTANANFNSEENKVVVKFNFSVYSVSDKSICADTEISEGQAEVATIEENLTYNSKNVTEEVENAHVFPQKFDFLGMETKVDENFVEKHEMGSNNSVTPVNALVFHGTSLELKSVLSPDDGNLGSPKIDLSDFKGTMNFDYEDSKDPAEVNNSDHAVLDESMCADNQISEKEADEGTVEVENAQVFPKKFDFLGMETKVDENFVEASQSKHEMGSNNSAVSVVNALCQDVGNLSSPKTDLSNFKGTMDFDSEDGKDVAEVNSSDHAVLDEYMCTDDEVSEKEADEGNEEVENAEKKFEFLGMETKANENFIEASQLKHKTGSNNSVVSPVNALVYQGTSLELMSVLSPDVSNLSSPKTDLSDFKGTMNFDYEDSKDMAEVNSSDHAILDESICTDDEVSEKEADEGTEEVVNAQQKFEFFRMETKVNENFIEASQLKHKMGSDNSAVSPMNALVYQGTSLELRSVLSLDIVNLSSPNTGLRDIKGTMNSYSENSKDVAEVNSSDHAVLDDSMSADDEVSEKEADEVTMEENFDYNNGKKVVETVETATFSPQKFNELEMDIKRYNEVGNFAEASLLKPEMVSDCSVVSPVNVSAYQGDEASKFDLAASSWEIKLFSGDITREEAQSRVHSKKNIIKVAYSKEATDVSIDDFKDSKGNANSDLEKSENAADVNDSDNTVLDEFLCTDNEVSEKQADVTIEKENFDCNIGTNIVEEVEKALVSPQMLDDLGMDKRDYVEVEDYVELSLLKSEMDSNSFAVSPMNFSVCQGSGDSKFSAEAYEFRSRETNLDNAGEQVYTLLHDNSRLVAEEEEMSEGVSVEKIFYANENPDCSLSSIEPAEDREIGNISRSKAGSTEDHEEAQVNQVTLESAGKKAIEADLEEINSSLTGLDISITIQKKNRSMLRHVHLKGLEMKENTPNVKSSRTNSLGNGEKSEMRRRPLEELHNRNRVEEQNRFFNN